MTFPSDQDERNTAGQPQEQAAQGAVPGFENQHQSTAQQTGNAEDGGSHPFGDHEPLRDKRDQSRDKDAHYGLSGQSASGGLGAVGAHSRMRQESFLAHLPRSFKLVVLVVLLLGMGWVIWPKKDSEKPTVISAPPKDEIAEAFEKATKEIRADDNQSSEGAEAGMGAEKGSEGATSAAPPPVPDSKESIAIAENDKDDHNARMATAPVQGLYEETAQGKLPIISDDGQKPWQIYARPFNQDDPRPRVSLVVMGLGLATAETDDVLQSLPAPVALAVTAQSEVAGAWMSRARQDGHEILLSLPMEPFDYPRSDPGPNTLLTSIPVDNNLHRLLWALGKGVGYIGVTTDSGSRFTTNPEAMKPILGVLRLRGLMIFDTKLAPMSVTSELAEKEHVPFATSTLAIPDDQSPDELKTSLRALEKIAKDKGQAIGYISITPLSLNVLSTWVHELPRRGIALAPLSAMVK